MSGLLHTGLGSSSIIAHVVHSPPPPPANSFVIGPAVINTHTVCVCFVGEHSREHCLTRRVYHLSTWAWLSSDTPPRHQFKSHFAHGGGKRRLCRAAPSARGRWPGAAAGAEKKWNKKNLIQANLCVFLGLVIILKQLVLNLLAHSCWPMLNCWNSVVHVEHKQPGPLCAEMIVCACPVDDVRTGDTCSTMCWWALLSTTVYRWGRPETRGKDSVFEGGAAVFACWGVAKKRTFFFQHDFTFGPKPFFFLGCVNGIFHQEWNQ